MLVATDFGYFRANPRELLSLVRAGGVFYGGLIAATCVGLWLVGRLQTPRVDDGRHGRARASRSDTSLAGWDASWPAAATAGRRMSPGR